MRMAACLFLLGTVLLFQLNDLPRLDYFLLLLVTLACLLEYRYCRYLLYLISGFTWALYVSHSIIQKSLDIDLEGIDIQVSGYVSSLPSNLDTYSRFDFEVIQLRDMDGNERTNPGHIRLYWYKPHPEIIPGQYLNLKVRLKQAHGLRNPGGFDYEAWLFQHGIRATGYIRGIETDTGIMRSRVDIHALRYKMRDRLQSLFSGYGQYYSLALALILGDRSQLTARQQELLIRTGTGHLLAISGLHIVLIAGFVFFISRWLWPLIRPTCHIMPAQKVAAVVSIFAALLYAVLSGFGIPAQRSVIMLIAIQVVRLLDMRIKSIDVLAFAMLVVLAANPVSVITAGFWLSFFAVALILYVLQGDLSYGKKSRFRSWCSIQCWICLGLSPVTAIWFNQISLWSLLANMMAIPWISLITLPALMIGLFLSFVMTVLSEYVLKLAIFSLEYLWKFLALLDGTGHFYYPVASPSLISLALAITGLAFMLIPQSLRLRIVAGLAFLPLCLPSLHVPLPGEFQLTVLDVGQGLSVVVKTHDHLLLFDTGPGSGRGYDAGRTVIIPFLRHSGFDSIDMIIQSHGDNDHIGGLESILADMSVSEVLSSIPDRVPHDNSRACHSGESWIWDGILFEIIHPGYGHDFQGNNASCVLKLSSRSVSVLLPGDIERQAEMSLLAENLGNLRVPVLLAPHHGSRTSSSPAFIRAVSAGHVVFSSGYLNRFRLPNQDIIKRYEHYGADLYNTATDGAVRIESTRNRFSISTERQLRRRFWNHMIDR